jgi:hypothetical protein
LIKLNIEIIIENITENPPLPPPRNRQNRLIRKYHKILPNLHNKFAIDQVFTIDTNEVFGIDFVLDIQKRAGNNGLFA